MSPTRLLMTLAVLVTVLGCGNQRRGLVCPSEMRPGNPDGRGERCIDDRSVCDSADDCAASGPCCEAACSDTGEGVFECTGQCSAPDCTDGSCGPDQYCQPGLDECTAYCVPYEIDCPDGMFPADPYGTGGFICVREDSECIWASECPQDPCCASTCADQGGGLFQCTQDCGDTHGGGAAPDSDADSDGDSDEIWECGGDYDCEALYGPGWTCDGCGSGCVPPPAQCQAASDCALAIDTSECCTYCGQAIPRSWLSDDTSCWLEVGASEDREPPGGDIDMPPPDCNPDCDSEPCIEIGCEQPTGVECRGGECVASY